jgi:hypothetical protein
MSTEQVRKINVKRQISPYRILFRIVTNLAYTVTQMPNKIPNPLTRHVLGQLIVKYGWRHHQIAQRTQLPRTSITMQVSGIRRIHSEHLRGYLRLPITEEEKDQLRKAWYRDNGLH